MRRGFLLWLVLSIEVVDSGRARMEREQPNYNPFASWIVFFASKLVLGKSLIKVHKAFLNYGSQGEGW